MRNIKHLSLPRMCGDDPRYMDLGKTIIQFAPHVRG